MRLCCVSTEVCFVRNDATDKSLDPKKANKGWPKRSASAKRPHRSNLQEGAKAFDTVESRRCGGACFGHLSMEGLLFCFALLEPTPSAARAEFFSTFVCQGMEAHILHGINLFSCLKVPRRASVSFLWIGEGKLRCRSCGNSTCKMCQGFLRGIHVCSLVFELSSAQSLVCESLQQ